MKRIIALITGVLMVILLLPFTACNEKKIPVEQYPGLETIEETVTSAPQEGENPAEDTEENVGDMSDEEFKELITNPDPFEKTGQFSYNPVTIPEDVAWKYRDNPQIIKNAQYIMYAVYNFDSEFEVPDEDVLKEEEFVLASILASESSPLVNAAMVDTEDYKHFTIKYLPQFVLHQDEDGSLIAEALDNSEQGYSQSIINGFVDYVTDLVNKNVSAEDSDMEKAKAIYEAIANDFSIEMDPYGSSVIITDEVNEGIPETISRNTLVEGVNERKLGQYEIVQLYQFILSQLNIECMSVLGSGTYHKKNIEELDNYMADSWEYTWNVVISEGKAYNCDLFMEIAVLENRRLTNPGSEADLAFFGMSDKTWDKTYTVNKASLSTYSSFYGMGATGGESKDTVPECAEDYNF